MEPISLFFPMYQEEGNIERAVAAAVEALSHTTSEFEIIVVDDGSTDRTAAIAQQLVAADERVRLVRHERNRGYGAAVHSGISASRLPLVFFTDGDNQFDLGELPAFVAELGDADMVCGYRIVRRDPWYRLLYAFGFNRLARILFRIPVRDVNCAFKLFRRSALDGLELYSSAALINVELLARACKRGALVVEKGVHHYPRQVGSQTGGNPAVIVRTFAELFRLWSELK